MFGREGEKKMEEGEKKKKKQLVHISISTRVTIRERLRLRLVIVAVEGIPAIAGESFTGNAKEKCLSSLFLLSSVPPIPPSDSLSPPPLPFSFARARLLFSNAPRNPAGFSAIPRMDFYLLPRKFTFVLRISTDRLCNRIAGRDLCPRIVCK